VLARRGGRPPRVVPVDPAAGPDELGAVVARIAADLADRYTSVAVVAIEPLRSSVGDLAASVLAPPDAKGLEFDAVVVVEPDAIAAGTSRGLRLLYVALTRAVQELVIVHARRLPPALVREPARWRTSPRWGARRRGT
jgi:superfamily I DNA/RNA helicase